MSYPRLVPSGLPYLAYLIIFIASWRDCRVQAKVMLTPECLDYMLDAPMPFAQVHLGNLPANIMALRLADGVWRAAFISLGLVVAAASAAVAGERTHRLPGTVTTIYTFPFPSTLTSL